MKIIKYKFLSCQINHGTEEEPILEDVLLEKTIPYNSETEEFAKIEAFNGEYTIEDDGVEEPTEQTQEERIAELEEALDMLLKGETE